MRNTVAINHLPECVGVYRREHAIIAIDVIRATTTAVTGAILGRRCFPVPSIEAALPLAARLDRPLLVGELGGNMPYGFDMTNSPVELAQHVDVDRPAILLSSSGTKLMYAAQQSLAAYVGCLRNYTALVRHMYDRHERIAIIGAGSRGEFREEDQMCCAWIAERLMDSGYKPEDERTAEIVKRWSGAPVEACLVSKSVSYLRNTHQEKDLNFILSHVDDLDEVFLIQHGELIKASPTETVITAAG